MRSSFVLVVSLFFSVAVAIYEAAAFYYGHSVGHSFQVVWLLVFNLLLLFWLLLDSRGRTEVYRPYDFGFLAFVFWVPYFPYYLVRTRHVRGILWFLGFMFLYYLGYLLQWLVYAVR